MTRETKIGVLVGLGFIVVFAVVLSHTGAPHPPGDGLQLVRGPDETLDLFASDGLEPIGSAPIDVPNEPIEEVIVSREPVGPPPSALPSPEELGTPLDVPPDTFVSGDSTAPAEYAVETDDRTVLIHPPRSAPPVDDPTPFERDREPSVSPTPAPVPSAPELEPNQPPTKLYIVRKGETLGRIAELHYGTSKPKVVDFLVKKNKGRIKSKDVVIEGQEIVIPELPSNMFEPAPNFQASNLNRNERLVLDVATPKQLNGRRAPRQDEANFTARPRTAGRSDYTIQPGDTLVKIAREQLGSDADWKEIQKLNKNLDPKKLRPGMKIRIPTRKPVSRSGTPKRVST